MKKGYAWTAGERVRTWTFWLLTIAIASQFYFVQELLAAFVLFGIGFAALTSVVLSLYPLQKAWELSVVRMFDSERWMARGTRTAIRLAAENGAQSKSPQDLKTENRNSKDWSGKASLNWAEKNLRALGSES